MKTKMLREDILSLWNVLAIIRKEKTGLKFHLAILEIKDAIEPIVKRLQDLIKPSERIMQYEKQRIALCEKYATKDEVGNPKVFMSQYVFSDESKKDFEAALEPLREEYKEDLDLAEANKNEFDSLLKTEEKVDIKKIPISQVPDTLSFSGADAEAFRLVLDSKSE